MIKVQAALRRKYAAKYASLIRRGNGGHLQDKHGALQLHEQEKNLY